MRGNWVIQVRDAISWELISQWKSHCQHDVEEYHQLASWSSNNTPYLAHSCWECGAVHVYDITRGQFIKQYKQKGVNPGTICRGPSPNTLLLLERDENRILQLHWTGDSLQPIKQIILSYHNAFVSGIMNPDICYSSHHGTIYLAGDHTVFCISLSGDQSGETLWQIGKWQEHVGGQQLDQILSVCCDPTGRLYIIEWHTGRLLVVDGKTGDLLHVHSLQRRMPQ